MKILRNKHLVWLLIILLIKSFVMTLNILFGKIGLSPDEAQYWTWSQALDWGYYSKPPGIAWGIFLGTQVFQNSEFGVRFFALVIGFLLPIATYFLAIACRLTKTTAFWSAIMMAFSPIGIAASFFATTDGSMTLFWVLATIVMVSGFNRNLGPNYLLLGLIIGCGALFKWPIYLFWIFPLIMKRFWSRSMIFGMLISLFGLFPSLIWNIQHDYATFRHVFSTVKGADQLSQSNFFEFLGAQIGLVSPILFVLMILSIIYLFKELKNISDGVKFCLFSFIGILIPFVIAASFKKMQGNWAVFAYPAAFVFTSYVMIEKKKYGKKWIRIGVTLSIFLTALVSLVPKLQINGWKIPYRLNAFRHNVGWNQLNLALKEVGFDPSNDFLFGDKYQTSSVLSFYSPEQTRAYFLNLQGIRHNQFSYWTSMKETSIGKTGYFVVAENSPHLEKEPEKLISDYQLKLSPFFKSVQFLGVKPLFTVDGKQVKAVFIFKGINYNGNEPKESSLY